MCICAYEQHEEGKCPWTCPKCGLRFPGGLGFGPACQCNSAREGSITAILKTQGVDAAVAFKFATDPPPPDEEGE